LEIKLERASANLNFSLAIITVLQCLALQRGQAMDVWRSCEVLGLVTLTFLYSFVIGCLMSYALIKVVYAGICVHSFSASPGVYEMFFGN